MKCLAVLSLILLLAGCATAPTLESRKQERYAAYQGLSPEMRAAVDRGTVKVGMPMDAVYIAWGRPAQISQRGSAAGEETIWLYTGGYVEETRFWGYRSIHYAYTPRSYVRAEVIFAQGVVREWRTLPEPVY